MLSYGEGIGLLEHHQADSRLISHSVGVSRVAHDMALKIPKSYEVNPEKVRVGGLLHDIGRTMGEPHELWSLYIVNWAERDKGLKPTISKIIIHGFLYELGGRKDKSLLPKGMENKLVVLADGYFGQDVMTLDERFEDIRKRHESDKSFLRALDLAKPRYQKLEEEINSVLMARV